MNKKLTKFLYSSPEVKVKELQARRTLCQTSLGSVEKYGSDLSGGEDLNF